MTTALRADAARNLELILEAAEAAFAEHGREAGVADIAQRAGVGQATIFRRFETKDDLIAAVFARKTERMLDVADAAARKRSAWDGLRSFMAVAVEMQVRDRALFQSFADRLAADPVIQARKQDLKGRIRELVARAKEEGSLRPDITADDIHALCCAAAQAGASGPGAWRRYLDVITEGMRLS